MHILGQFENVNTDGFPSWLKALIWVSMGLAAASVIWDKVHGREFARIILKELTTNGGKSMKDEVTRGMIDSKEALKISKEIQVLQKQQHNDLDGRMAKVEVGVEDLKMRLGGVDDRVATLEKEFARFIKHQANNDLNRSALMKEAVDLLGRENGG
jgi:hypothetical protein